MERKGIHRDRGRCEAREETFLSVKQYALRAYTGGR